MTLWSILLGTVIAACVAPLVAVLSVRILSRAGSRVRQGILHTGLVLVCVAPLAPLTAAWLGCGWSTSLGRAPVNALSSNPATTTRLDRSNAENAAFARGTEAGRTLALDRFEFEPRSSAAPPAIPWLTIVLMAWGLGAAWRIGRIIRAQRGLARALACATRAPESLRRRLDAAARRVGLADVPVLLEAPIRSPFSIARGRRRPAAIVLPPRPAPCSIDGAPDDLALDAILIHECGHFAHGHHRFGQLVQCALVLHWCNPFVHALGRAIREVHEDVADDYVLQHDVVPARDYARLLVDFAECAHGSDDVTSATSAIALLPRGTGSLTRRIRGLIDPRRRPMTSLTRRGAGTTAALSSIATLAMLVAVPAQDPEGPARERHEATAANRLPRDEPDESYLPLAAGATWRFRVQRPERDATTRTWTALRTVRIGDNESCWELRTRERDLVGWKYVGVQRLGVFDYPRAMLGRYRGVRRHGTGARILATPIGTEMTWRWDTTVERQTGLNSAPRRGTADEDDRSAPVIQSVATLLAVSEEIEVPSGTYHAARVETTAHGPFGTTTTTRWWAPNIGLVRERTQRDGAVVEELVLEDFQTGHPESTATPDATLAGWLGEQNLADSAHRWINDAELESQLATRFAIVGSAASDARLVATYMGSATEFDPRRSDDWQTLLERESYDLHEETAGLTLTRVTSAAAKLDAHRRFGVAEPGLRVSVLQSRSSTRPGTGVFTVVSNAVVLHENGEQSPIRARLEASEGRIRSITIEERAPASSGGR